MMFDVASTISKSTLIAPDSPDSTVYDEQDIANVKGENAKQITLTNDGQGNIFVRVSHNGLDFTYEVPIYESDVKIYYDVNKILLRGDRAGCKYRITEYPLNNVISNVQKSERIESVSTDKDVHFTGALSINQIQTVNISGLLSNKIRIVAINGQSVQPLKYRLIFWGSSTTLNISNLNADTYLTDVVMDFSDTLSAFQIDTGAGLVNQVYLDVSALDGLYEDADSVYTLHASLQNLSSIAKIAGASGAVQFDIKYAMRL